MSVVNTEDKHIDFNQSNTTVTPTSSQIFPIIPPAAGTSIDQRIGDSIKVHKFQANLLFQYGCGTTAQFESQMLNWYLVRYLKTPPSSGTSAFTIAEFLDTDVNSNYTPLSMADPNTNENFVVMGSGTVQIDLNTLAVANVLHQRLVTFEHNCQFHQTFNGSANTSICDNMCFFVVTALNAANTGGTSNVSITSRYFYIDN